MDASDLRDVTLNALRQYNQFISDAPESKEILIQDNTVMTYLKSVLRTSDDKMIIRTALEFLWELISGQHGTISPLISNDDFKNILNDLYQKFQTDLTIAFLCESNTDQIFPGHKQHKGATSTLNVAGRSRAPRFLQNTRNRQAQTLVFQSQHFFDNELKRAVEQHLVKTQGVISIYFDSTGRMVRCVIRVTSNIAPDVIARTILAVQGVTSIDHITKNEYGEETVTSFVAEATPEKGEKNIEIKLENGKNSSPLPAYLEENDEIYFDEMRAVLKFGQDEKKQNGGWFSNVSSFFSKTLYW